MRRGTAKGSNVQADQRDRGECPLDLFTALLCRHASCDQNRLQVSSDLQVFSRVRSYLVHDDPGPEFTLSEILGTGSHTGSGSLFMHAQRQLRGSLLDPGVWGFIRSNISNGDEVSASGLQPFG